MTKRIFDLICACAGLLLLVPVIGLLALLIKAQMGSPVVFSQQRPGLNGRPFCIYKFRTMTNQRDELGQLLPDDVRLTPLGAWLRRNSLDELPQLINVIKGELSLIGPRPLAMEYLPLYSKDQARRHEVLPGITGWAQVNGRNAISWDEKFALDVWYVDHQTFWLDLRIIVMTLVQVFNPDEITKTQVTISDFTGTREPWS